MVIQTAAAALGSQVSSYSYIPSFFSFLLPFYGVNSPDHVKCELTGSDIRSPRFFFSFLRCLYGLPRPHWVRIKYTVSPAHLKL